MKQDRKQQSDRIGSSGAASAKVGRRELLKGVVAAAAVAAAPATLAQEAKSPTVSVDDLKGFEHLTGLNYTDRELAQMAETAGETRVQLTAMRSVKLGPTVEPAIRFDAVLPGNHFAPGASSVTLSRKHAEIKYAGDIESLAFASVVELARLMKAGTITSVALTRMYLARLKKYGPHLNCVVNLREEAALKEAARADHEIASGKYRGPLHGIPWGAKDLLATRDAPTTWGAKPFEHQMFDYDATVVKRLAAAGAVLVAKLSMGELAMGDVWFGGRTRNPWKPERGSSGSSAGPGSATAAGLVGFSIGTETLGSIVSPSVVNGVTGLRPTFGRVSRHGAMALSWTMDKIGPMCRGVEDCALVFAAIQGPDGQDRTVVDTPFHWEPDAGLHELRFGIDESAFENSTRDPNRSTSYGAALDVIKSLGVKLTPVHLPARKDYYEAIAEIVINCEGAASFVELDLSGKLDQLAQQGNNSWPNIFRTGSTIPAADYLQAMRLRSQLQAEMAKAMAGLDGYVTAPFSGPTLVYTNLTGHPTLITRCGMRDGMPQSIEIVGGLFREAAILRLGLAYEQATSWHKQWPDLSRIV